YFQTPRGQLHAVDDVSFKIEQGKTLGVVGESGCGKTTLGRVILHLLDSTDGKMLFQGEDITRPSARRTKELRSDMQIIFQDPFSSLNPRMTISETIGEPLKLVKRLGGEELSAEVRRLMDSVGLAQRLINAFPHELDGGRRQRIGIARALALDPKFIVCDEPVSALDVSIQAQILNLILGLQEERGLTYIFITHNLSVVNYISDDICVMYLGQVVETCASDELFKTPLHPYTQALLSAIPSPDIFNTQKRIILQGELASPINPKPGCRFAPRCLYATDECRLDASLTEVSPGHFVACRRVNQIMTNEGVAT
ncbi:MAG: ATP-binding cassette domain-containing protein, partial [Spirochaetaceae bacterium]|nr:ATP-binding cassette domain-containing protein [Spirochaetaceae bacterium]